MNNRIEWTGDKECRVGDVLFRVETGDDLYAADPGVESFVIGKSKRQLEALQDLLIDKSIRRICELGIYKGGSVVLNFELFQPEILMAFDLETNPVASLEGYIHKMALKDRIRTFYGVDQADKAALRPILKREMGNAQFDLIVDDASHFLDETKASFNLLFPYLAVGGYYIIEDWGWAHWPGLEWQDNGGIWKDKPALTNLIYELVISVASCNRLIESVFLLPAYAVVKRGGGRLDCEKDEFDISNCCLNRGNAIPFLT